MGRQRVTDDSRAEWPEFLLGTKAMHLSDDQAPILFDMREKDAAARLEKFVSDRKGQLEVLDEYAEQFAELQLSLNPQLYRANPEVQRASIGELLASHYAGAPAWQKGVWVYFGWNGQFIHTLEKEEFLQLRSIRNRDLITTDEQNILADYHVGCCGMSVGSAGALALGISGISLQLKISDGAVISGSNLNRILTGISSVGLSKSTVIARKVYEMNPFAEIDVHGKLEPSGLADFFSKSWKLDLIIDEIDDLEMKVALRAEARKRKIPVIMATELGDSVMIDIERFDLEPDRPLFHNLIKDIEQSVVGKKLSQRQWMKHATTIIDPVNMPIRMHQSLQKIGSTIVTHPQLGSTVMTTGGILTFIVKQIALQGDMPSQRTLIPLESLFMPSMRTRKSKKEHKRNAAVIKKAMDAITE